MRRHPANIWLLCAIFLAAGCASAPPPAKKEPELVIPKHAKPAPPEYDAKSDAVFFGRRESRALVEAGCAMAESPATCRKQADERLRGYRGAFSADGAQEVLVALRDAAVLLARTDGRWKARARAVGLDVGHCLVTQRAGKVRDGEASDGDLICRSVTTADWGYGLAFFRVSAHDDQLEVSSLDAPHAADIDTALFAGWKREGDAIEVRFHKEGRIKGTTEIGFDGPEACRYRTFRYRPSGEPTLAEIDACERAKTASDNEQTERASRRSGVYEDRLQAPIAAHNRAYAMCYQRELDRLKEEAEEDEQAKEDERPQVTNAQEDGEEDKLLAGDVHARFIIGASGAPVSCQVLRSTLHNPNVESCLCRELMNTPFPPVPSGKFVDVTYPFSFAPPQ